jgi:hypothetical protein
MVRWNAGFTTTICIETPNVQNKKRSEQFTPFFVLYHLKSSTYGQFAPR